MSLGEDDPAPVEAEPTLLLDPPLDEISGPAAPLVTPLLPEFDVLVAAATACAAAAAAAAAPEGSPISPACSLAI